MVQNLPTLALTMTREREPNEFAPTPASTPTSPSNLTFGVGAGPESDSGTPPTRADRSTQDLSATHVDPSLTNTEIRLLSIYSGYAAEEVGGNEVIEAKINIAVSQVNTAFERADVPSRVSVAAHKRMEMDGNG